MHETSMVQMSKFVQEYLDVNKDLTILDVGSLDINGSYKPLFSNPKWTYFGLDVVAGPNVDVVASAPYDWGLDIKYDVVISGQCLEHVPDTKLWILEIKKVLNPGGIVCVIAPFMYFEHKYPVDCWRILPDGISYLLHDVCGYTVLKAYIEGADCVGIAKNEGV